MATTVFASPTLKQVQWLVDLPRGGTPIVSCYLDRSVAVPPVWSAQLGRRVREIEATAGDANAAKTIAAAIDVVRSIVASRQARNARGIAAFVSTDGGLMRAFLLDSPLLDRLVVDEQPYVVPLLEYLHRHRRYLVVHTDTHRGRLYTAGRGGVHLIESLDENVPKRHRAGLETWGKQQATIARHREDHILHYRKELIREIERAWSEESYDGLVLLGAHEVLAHVADDLPPALARGLVHTGPRAWVGRQPTLASAIAAISATAMLEHDRQLLDELRVRLREGHGIACGAEEVLNALRSGQVGHAGCVVMEADRGDIAARCTGCRWVFAHEEERCPFCRALCEKTNLWQEIALAASARGIKVHFVGADSSLQSRGGVAAFVTRKDPWANRPPGRTAVESELAPR